MNTSLSVLNKHFSAFKVRQHSCRRSIVWWSRLLWVSVSGPCTTMSSEMFSTPSIPARAEAMSCWYCSLAEQTPKSKRFYRNKPSGVAMVVISLDSGLNSHWWYPHLRWLDWIFLGGYLPSLSINYVAMSKDMEKRLPELYYITMKISYDLGFIATGVAIAT